MRLPALLLSLSCLAWSADDWIPQVKALSDAGITGKEAIAAVLAGKSVTAEDVARARAQGINSAILAHLASFVKAAPPTTTDFQSSLDGPNRALFVNLLSVILRGTKPDIQMAQVGPTDALRGVCIRLLQLPDVTQGEAALKAAKQFDEQLLARLATETSKQISGSLKQRDQLAAFVLGLERFRTVAYFPGKEKLPELLLDLKAQINGSCSSAKSESFDPSATIIANLPNMPVVATQVACRTVGCADGDACFIAAASGIIALAKEQNDETAKAVSAALIAAQTAARTEQLMLPTLARLSQIRLEQARAHRLGDQLGQIATLAGSPKPQVEVIRWQCLSDTDRSSALPKLLHDQVLPSLSSNGHFLTAWSNLPGVIAFTQTFGEHWMWAWPDRDFQGLTFNDGSVPSEGSMLRMVVSTGPVPGDWATFRSAIPFSGWTGWTLTQGQVPFKVHLELHEASGRIMASSPSATVVLPAGTTMPKKTDTQIYITSAIEKVTWMREVTSQQPTGKTITVSGNKAAEAVARQGLVVTGAKANGDIELAEMKNVTEYVTETKECRKAVLSPVPVVK